MSEAWAGVPEYIETPRRRIQHRDSLENKVLEFFDRNPDEELTTVDAVVKFDTEYVHMSKTFKTMFERGLLRRHRDGGPVSPWLYGGVLA